jgi:pantothenate kinase-related protein Tda10
MADGFVCGARGSGDSAMASELDRQVADYKRRADAEALDNFTRADALWLLNELIYERDLREARLVKRARKFREKSKP